MNCVVCGRPLDNTPGNHSDDVCWREVIPPASNGDYWTDEDARVCYRLGFMRLHAENRRLRKVLVRLAARSKVAREALAAPATAAGEEGGAVKLRYVVPGDSLMHSPDVPLTAKELRDWKGRVVAGRFFLRPEEDGWTIYANTVVGTLGAIDTVALVEEFTLFREGLAALKRYAAGLRMGQP